MIDLRALRQDPEVYRANYARRGVPANIDHILELDVRRRALTLKSDELRAEQKQASKKIPKVQGTAREEILERMRGVSEDLTQAAEEKAGVEAELETALAALPNLAHESAALGGDRVERSVGDAPVFDFPVRDHLDIGEALDIIDAPRGARVSGARFAYLKGYAALLELALIRYTVDRLVAHGFTPVVPPVLVRREAMYGTGFLPTDEAQIYKTTGDQPEDELYLVGTSEVPLAALHMSEILDEKALPLRYAGISTCFRREAGTYGKDTRGIFRVHQFDKVEMFSFSHPDTSWDEHDFLVSCQEDIVGGLGLHYRVVNISADDLGASAAKKYDLEAWLPSQQTYREVTSCSNCTDYQARRLACRFRPKGGGAPALVHTLNGTAVAVGRTLIAILENYQQADGSVVVPEALRPYLPGLDRLTPKR
ncbi:MAG: serine--tRNA ligase [Actinomycetota bacterium]